MPAPTSTGRHLLSLALSWRAPLLSDRAPPQSGQSCSHPKSSDAPTNARANSPQHTPTHTRARVSTPPPQTRKGACPPPRVSLGARSALRQAREPEGGVTGSRYRPRRRKLTRLPRKKTRARRGVAMAATKVLLAFLALAAGESSGARIEDVTVIDSQTRRRSVRHAWLAPSPARVGGRGEGSKKTQKRRRARRRGAARRGQAACALPNMWLILPRKAERTPRNSGPLARADPWSTPHRRSPTPRQHPHQTQSPTRSCSSPSPRSLAAPSPSSRCRCCPSPT